MESGEAIKEPSFSNGLPDVGPGVEQPASSADQLIFHGFTHVA